MDNVVRIKEFEWLKNSVLNWKNGKGAIVSLQAEQGFGKTFLLNAVQDYARLLDSGHNTSIIYVECTPPISSVVQSSIQPLQPFGNAIEQLYMNSAEAAKKRFALNVGLSLVSALPFIGDVLYAVKAVSQDITEYKRETAAMQQKKKSAVDECVRSLIEIAKNTPLLLVVDDAHYCDSQSIEVLRKLVAHIEDVPLLIVWAITPSLAKTSNQPLLHLFREQYFVAKACVLPELQAQELSTLLGFYTRHNIVNTETENILIKRAAGNASVLVEYITYLIETSSLLPDGSVIAGTLEEISPSAAEHPATSIALQDLAESDADLLCLCAAEGKEFTVFMLAALTNTSTLQVIRELRKLSKSGLIKSIGMRTRYGIKTTVYEFTKSFTYTFFVHRLEYEERKSIHQRIAEILHAEYNKTLSEEEKFALSAIIAEHSLEAENIMLSEQMLATSIAYTKSIGADEVQQYIRQNLLTTTTLELGSETNANQTIPDNVTPNLAWQDIRELLPWLADAMVEGRYADVYAQVQMYNSSTHNILGIVDHTKVVCLGARAASLLGNSTEAELFLSQLTAIQLPLTCEILVLNTQAMMLFDIKNTSEALILLENAASLCENVTSVERVLTLSNIYLVLQESESTLQSTYEEALRTLMSQYGLTRLRADLHL